MKTLADTHLKVMYINSLQGAKRELQSSVLLKKNI